MASLLLIISLAGAIALIGAIAVNVRRRKIHRALLWGACLVGLVTVYTAALMGAALASESRELTRGQEKCFDEWCTTLENVATRGSTLQLRVRVRNAGRTAQRPDSPHAYLHRDGRDTPLAVPGLADRLGGGERRTLDVTIPLADATGAELVITEGSFPTDILIGDENSPFHAKETWPLAPAG